MTDGNRLAVVADSDGEVRAALFRLLDDAGYSVATHSSGYEALKHACRQSPDVVVSGTRFPDLDGAEFLGKLREASPRTKILLLADPADGPRFVRVLEAGRDRVLSRWVVGPGLVEVVNRMLRPSLRFAPAT